MIWRVCTLYSFISISTPPPNDSSIKTPSTTSSQPDSTGPVPRKHSHKHYHPVRSITISFIPAIRPSTTLFLTLSHRQLPVVHFRPPPLRPLPSALFFFLQPLLSISLFSKLLTIFSIAALLSPPSDSLSIPIFLPFYQARIFFVAQRTSSRPLRLQCPARLRLSYGFPIVTLLEEPRTYTQGFACVSILCCILSVSKDKEAFHAFLSPIMNPHQQNKVDISVCLGSWPPASY